MACLAHYAGRYRRWTYPPVAASIHGLPLLTGQLCGVVAVPPANPCHALKWVKLDTCWRWLSIWRWVMPSGWLDIQRYALRRVRVEVPAVMLDALEIVQRPKNFFADPHISRPPDFHSKNLSKIFRLIREYIRYWNDATFACQGLSSGLV